MPASGTADDDASKQHLKIWAQSWHRIQQEHIDGYMDDIHRFLHEHHTSMQNVMAHSFDEHLQRMQGCLTPNSFNLEIIDVHDDKMKGKRTPTFEVLEDFRERGTKPSIKTRSSKSSSAAGHMELVNSIRQAARGKSQHTKQTDLYASRSLANLVPADRVQEFFVRICNSVPFELLTALVVITNAVLIAVDANYALKHALKTGRYKPLMPKFVDMVFLVLFSLELMCRIMAKRHFFYGRDRWWNVFDVFIVGTSLAELFLETLNISSFRVLRVFRIVRVIRIIRSFKQLRELRVMLASILVSFLSLFWGVVLMTLVMFLFGTVLTQGAANYIEDQDVVPANVQHGLESHFPSLSGAMFTLLAVISGGVDWTDVTAFLWDISQFYFYIFVFYVCFVYFGVLNVLTAVFVDTSSNISKIDSNLVHEAEIERNETVVNQLESLFRELDVDNSGEVDWAEFQQHLHDKRVLASFANLNIEVSEATSMFRLLDTDESGSVLIEEFVLGCMRLKGMAKAIDIAMMMYETKKQSLESRSHRAEIQEALSNVFRQVQSNHDAIQNNMRQIHRNTNQIHSNMERISACQRQPIRL